mgnify:CR=1 FL=1
MAMEETLKRFGEQFSWKPVVEHKDDKDVAAPQRPLPAGKKAPEPTGQTVVQDAARLLIINQQPSKKVE